MEKKHETQFYFSLFFLNRVAAFANNCNEVYKNEKLNKEMNGKEEEKRNKTPIKWLESNYTYTSSFANSDNTCCGNM